MSVDYYHNPIYPNSYIHPHSTMSVDYCDNPSSPTSYTHLHSTRIILKNRIPIFSDLHIYLHPKMSDYHYIYNSIPPNSYIHLHSNMLIDVLLYNLNILNSYTHIQICESSIIFLIYPIIKFGQTCTSTCI